MREKAKDRRNYKKRAYSGSLNNREAFGEKTSETRPNEDGKPVNETEIAETADTFAGTYRVINKIQRAKIESSPDKSREHLDQEEIKNI